jgi:hypothetical protein
LPKSGIQRLCAIDRVVRDTRIIVVPFISTLQLDELLKPLPAVWELQHSALFYPQ